MRWFVASIVSVIKYDQGEQSGFPVVEHFYLFSAESQAEEDRKVSEKMALMDAAGKCIYNGLPATRSCIGVRKIRSIFNPPPLAMNDDPPIDGTELTHSFFSTNSIDEAMDVAAGKRVTVLYVDDD